MAQGAEHVGIAYRRLLVHSIPSPLSSNRDMLIQTSVCHILHTTVCCSKSSRPETETGVQEARYPCITDSFQRIAHRPAHEQGKQTLQPDRCCCCCCYHINSQNQVYGHRTGSSHPEVEEYPTEKHTNKTRSGTRINHIFVPAAQPSTIYPPLERRVFVFSPRPLFVPCARTTFRSVFFMVHEAEKA